MEINLEALKTDEPIKLNVATSYILEAIITIASLDEQLFNSTMQLDLKKASLKEIEARHMELIATDKVNYPNAEARTAALTHKCAVDPLHQQLTGEYNKLSSDIADIKRQLELNRSARDTWNTYIGAFSKRGY